MKSPWRIKRYVPALIRNDFEFRLSLRVRLLAGQPFRLIRKTEGKFPHRITAEDDRIQERNAVFIPLRPLFPGKPGTLVLGLLLYGTKAPVDHVLMAQDHVALNVEDVHHQPGIVQGELLPSAPEPAGVVCKGPCDAKQVSRAHGPVARSHTLCIVSDEKALEPLVPPGGPLIPHGFTVPVRKDLLQQLLLVLLGDPERFVLSALKIIQLHTHDHVHLPPLHRQHGAHELAGPVAHDPLLVEDVNIHVFQGVCQSPGAAQGGVFPFCPAVHLSEAAGPLNADLVWSGQDLVLQDFRLFQGPGITGSGKRGSWLSHVSSPAFRVLVLMTESVKIPINSI